MSQLTIHDHSRLFSNFMYVYPVVSRRAQGVSLGINLNVNNACNWRCVYCQVDGLVRGKPTKIDLSRIEYELDYMLDLIINGDFIAKNAPPDLSRFNDICLSGNGESTLSHEFYQVVKIIVKLRLKYNLKDNIKSILISNGSEVEREEVQEGLRLLAFNNGEVWFKIDRATPDGVSLVNQVHLSMDGVRRRLLISTQACKTYIQTCMFRVNEIDPSDEEVDKYIEFVASVRNEIAGILLYSTARNPALPEGDAVSSVSVQFLKAIANRLSQLNINVKYYQ